MPGSEVRWALLDEGGDAFAVLGGAHRFVEQAERVGDRGGWIVAQEIVGDLALGHGDGVRADRVGEESGVAQRRGECRLTVGFDSVPETPVGGLLAGDAHGPTGAGRWRE